MSKDIIGIDLGTTNSCVAMRGSVEKCYEIPGIQGYSIVTDKRKRKTTPFVVAYTGHEKNPYEIGHNAKTRVDGKYPPVMFAKRDMGTNKKFQIDEEKFITPVQASAEILKYLKKMAGERIGKKINRAVVTVPAYFSIPQKKQTRDALQMAGFQVDDERYIIQEPVAAALTYVQLSREDSLRIMVYDLGGGTFDITILQKNGDLIQVIQFGGDHALGGYDFDRLLADYLVDQLKECGYALKIDPQNNPDDRMIYTKLLLEAEETKIELSRHDVHHIRRPALFKDQEGETVDLDMDVERKTFEKLIFGKVEETIEHCRGTLDKSRLSIDQINRIIIVGGSSYIPYIQQRLEEEFNRKPELMEPDLCIAMGAAIHASRLGSVVEQEVTIRFDMLPSETSLDEAEISGAVSSKTSEPLADGYSIEVADHAGSFRKSSVLEDENAFYFNVPLQQNTKNTFRVRVLNRDGRVDAETEIEIIHSSEAEESDENMTTTSGVINLPKSIYVKRENGPEQLAPEGAGLPYEEIVEVPIIKKGKITDDMLLDLDIKVLEKDCPIGTVTVTKIPGSIENNAPVKIGIKVTPDFQIIVSVHLPTVDRRAKAVFTTSIVDVLSRENIIRELEEIEDEWESRKIMLDREKLAKWGMKISKAIKRAKECLKGNDPDTTEASNTLTSLKEMMDIIRKDDVILIPSMDKFKRLCDETRKLIKKAEEKSSAFRDTNRGRTLDAVISQAKSAWAQKSQDKWEEANKAVEELARVASEVIDGRESERPDPKLLCMQLIMMVSQLKDEVEKLSNFPDYQRWKAKLDEISGDLEEIQGITDENEMFSRIVNVYREKIEPLNDEIREATGGGVDPIIVI